MDSKKYWEQREEEALRSRITDEAEYDRRINQIYSDMLDGIQGEIDTFYRKYADTEGISITEAKKRVSDIDIEEYKQKAAKYVQDADQDRRLSGGKTNYRGYYFSSEANAEMRLYNATMKINRLEMLKANIGLEMLKGHAELETFMNNILQGRTEDELRRQASILGDTIRDNAKMAHSIVNGSFHNATFSNRIWQYHDVMKADLSKLLQTGLIQGKNPRTLAREIKKYVLGDAKGGARFNAERLMRTELARVQTDAQQKSFERMDFDEYTFHANSGCCDACQKLDGKHFKVKDMMPGENAPPIHPNCRCSTSAYEDSDEYEAWLDYLSKGGTTEEWNATGKTAWQQGKSLTDTSKNDIMQTKYGFKTIKGEHSADTDAGLSNPNYRKGREYQINCQRCVPTYEMRRRGYDVEALPYKTAKDPAYNQWRNIFKDAKWDSSVASNRGARTQQRIIDKMVEYGDGARAEIYCVWKGASSAHVFAVENVGGKVRFIDPQTGSTNCEGYFKQLMPSRTMMCRIDQLEPSDLIADCCTNKG